eukprot:4746558-Prymnesium_polylepis.1
MRCCGGVESFTSIMAADHDAIPSSVCAPVRARSLSICHAFSVGTCGDSLRRRFPFALAGEVSGFGGARTPRRRIQLGAAAAA